MFVIDKDFIENGRHNGRVFNEKDGVTYKLEFILKDDDGETYYQGRMTDDDPFEPLDDFGMPNAGCTEIRIRPLGSKEAFEIV